MSDREPALTTTSYAILGLLHVRPHTAYELAAQARRSLRFTWPTAESRLYAEPKRLAARGLVEVTEEAAGPTRTRQLLTITDEGRAALQGWLATEPAAPRAELEVLLRVLFGDAGSVGDLRAAVAATGEQARGLYADGIVLLAAYRDEGVAFPERLHLNLLWIALVQEVVQTIIDWTDFATATLDGPVAEHGFGDSPPARVLLDRLLDAPPPVRRWDVPPDEWAPGSPTAT